MARICTIIQNVAHQDFLQRTQISNQPHRHSGALRDPAACRVKSQFGTQRVNGAQYPWEWWSWFADDAHIADINENEM